MRSRLIQGLRIATTCLCGAICILMIVSWSRSFGDHDLVTVKLTPSRHATASIALGRMCIWLENGPCPFLYRFDSWPLTDRVPNDSDDRIPWFDVGFWPTFTRIYAAHWVFVAFFGALAALPWTPRRVSLRGAFVGMTAVAAIIGLIAWVDRTL